MIKKTIFLLSFLVSLSSFAQEDSKSIEQFVNEIDKKIPQLLNDFTVPGAAIAIIENGEVILQKGYGYADIEKGIKVNTKTGFNIGSISKTIAAWGVMKLVQEGKIDLDAPAEKYLTRWHLPESEFDSDGVTIRRLLSHTAGLSLHGYPGWSPNDTLPTLEESLNGKNNGPGRVEIIMEPGTKYKYSGGGFSILQLIIEEVTKQKFEDYMQAQILNQLGMTNSSYKIDNRIMAASSLEYDRFGELIDFELFTAQAAAGLHITIEDFTHFALANLYRIEDHEKYNPVLSTDIIQQMMKPVPEAKGRFGYGLGYMVESIPGTSVLLGGHRGANTGWQAIFNVNPETNDGFIMVTNGGAGQDIYHPIFFDWVLWKIGVPLEDWYNAKPPISKKLKSIIDSNGIDDITTIYTELKKNQPDKYDFSESKLNELGYHCFGKDDLEKSIAIFKLNVEAFPDSYNVYDSYGEALLKSGDKEGAIENYSKSVELHPGNEYGIKVLKDLGVETDKLIKEINIDDAVLKSYVGKFELASGKIITISKYDGQLKARSTGNPQHPIFPKSKSVFYYKVDQAQLTFNQNKDGVVESVTLLQADQERIGKKLVDRNDHQLIIDDFEKRLKSDLTDDNIGGSISATIVKGNKIIWSKAFGTLDTDNDINADSSTIYRTGSISKSFTAFLMMQLAEEGIIEIHEPIEKYLPEISGLNGYSDSTKITFQQLASHTSGLIREPDLEKAASGPIEEWENKILLSIPETSFQSNPGAVYSYSNIGFGILGLALSRAADKSFIELVKDKIFEPLNMSNSFFIVPNDKLMHLAKGMERGQSGWLDKETPEKEHLGRGYKVPNGGIYSSPNDLAKFMISNLGYSEIINKNNLAIMQRKQTPGEERWQNYGLGFSLYQDDVISTVGHGGSVSGYTADFLFEKQSQYGVILMRNYNWGSTNLNSQAVNLLKKLRKLDLEQGK